MGTFRTITSDYVSHERKTEQYQNYLASEQWQSIAKKRMQIDKHCCQGCKCKGTSTNPLTVHHLTYKHLYHENENNNYYTDLVTLCYSCHTNLHNIMERQTNEQGRKGWSDRDDLPILCNYIIDGQNLEHIKGGVKS